uniref:Uncharacterized protein n=1 Tax=uncultured bacterium A1Q1_fos_291 TaxID=1256570 RepID=L7VWT8_9BACT|nr:hypothetical protein [uncultured bacterium A1Q1_fos_291]
MQNRIRDAFIVVNARCGLTLSYALACIPEHFEKHCWLQSGRFLRCV